ncbi:MULTISPECIES: AAA family ATPase [unclassified Microcoleus]|uniref:AAA family ATPase n=1 Tax=unclassified Microcoleus TaxID=2642155 RepID=UPI002FCF66AF
MSNQLTHLQIKNFRSLADVNIQINPLNIIFGPNGAGKTTLLDTIWFVRDCAIRGVDLASSERDHGIGLLWDGADEGENISIKIVTPSGEYEVSFGYSSGRIEPFAGEKLFSNHDNKLIVRIIGSDKAQVYRTDLQELEFITLREPEKLALTRYIAFENSEPAASNIDNLLRVVRNYNSRSASLFKIKRFGSESDSGERLQDRCENLWSVLRNLHDKRVIDERYDTIISFMQESFPAFDNLFFEQTGRYTVYGNFLEKGRRKPIRSSGVSDGHLQMLINLTALFSEGQNRYSLILFDEPEISLHPWALAVFAKAVKLATEKWNKQVFIATHSPVLISQFEPENILTAELDKEGKTVLKRISEIEGIQDLLEEYATGSLYMAEMIAPQSKSALEVAS